MRNVSRMGRTAGLATYPLLSEKVGYSISSIGLSGVREPEDTRGTLAGS